jgi:hypothetical protein
MEWDFTPEDVVQGRIGYGLSDFRADLASEVKLNLPDNAGEIEGQRLFNLIYDLCYALATGRELDEFEREVEADPWLSGFLHMVARHSEDNVAMLGAILQRSIMDGVAAGLPLDQAIQAAASQHALEVASRAGANRSPTITFR